MKINYTEIIKIKSTYEKIENITDFIGLINSVKLILYPELKFDFTLKHLNYFAFEKKIKYYSFNIPKKSGDFRQIEAPIYYVKVIQRCINFILSSVFQANKSAFGFVIGKSIRNNAEIHINKKYVYNIDLLNFFPSIEFRRVKTVLSLNPFNMDDKLAYLVANLCCNNGFLPQGAPTSPIISNIICQKLDRKCYKLSKIFKSNYSRYADDITFSADKNVFGKRFNNELEEIIKSENFEINLTKKRLQDRNERQSVTGLIVNEKVNVKREFIREIRVILDKWGKYGYEEALNSYIYANKINKIASFISLEKIINGKLEFLKLIRGKDDIIYQKYNSIFLNLKGTKIKNSEIEITSYHEETEIYEDKWYEDSKNHNPKALTEFIKNFSKANHPFQLLVHQEPLEVFGNLDNNLKKLNEEIEKFIKKNGRFSSRFWFYLDNFKKAYESSEIGGGRYIWNKYQIPPASEADEKFLNEIIKPFKRKYRFGEGKGNENDNEETNFVKMISQKHKNDVSLSFSQDVEQLPTFYTDVERVEWGISYLLRSIKKNSKGEKLVGFDTEFDNDYSFLIIKIIDNGSYFNKNPKLILTWMGSKLKRARQNFFSVCDWEFIAYFRNHGNYKITILPDYKYVKLNDTEPLQSISHYIKFNL
jgi:RNA-directed DNA polymerase